MAARKSPTYRKAAALPRGAGEAVKRTTVWLSESDQDWLRSRFGKNAAFGIRSLIAAAKGGRRKKASATSMTTLTAVCVTCERPFEINPDVPHLVNAPVYCNRADCS